MNLPLLQQHLRGRWRMLWGNCPACNDSPFRAYECYVCGVGLILPRFRWARFIECLNP